MLVSAISRKEFLNLGKIKTDSRIKFDNKENRLIFLDCKLTNKLRRIMRWNNIQELVHALEENYPDEEISSLTTQDVYDFVLSLAEFEDDPEHFDEKRLAAILEHWLELRELES